MPLLFLSHVLHSTLIDWLIFKALFRDQVLYNLSLIKLCSACGKQNAAVNAVDACSLLAK